MSMYMYTYMYVYVYMYMYICTCVHVYICTSMSVHVYMYIHMYLWIYFDTLCSCMTYDILTMTCILWHSCMYMHLYIDNMYTLFIYAYAHRYRDSCMQFGARHVHREMHTCMYTLYPEGPIRLLIHSTCLATLLMESKLHAILHATCKHTDAVSQIQADLFWTCWRILSDVVLGLTHPECPQDTDIWLRSKNQRCRRVGEIGKVTAEAGQQCRWLHRYWQILGNFMMEWGHHRLPPECFSFLFGGNLIVLEGGNLLWSHISRRNVTKKLNAPLNCEIVILTAQEFVFLKTILYLWSLWVQSHKIHIIHP